MKKLLLIMICFFAASEITAQNFNWITPNKQYLKMYIAEDGIYRIDKQDFVNAGIPVSSIDPRTVKVWYKGNQTPIYFNGEADGVFNDTDWFDFMGYRNYGGISNCYEEVSGSFVTKYSVDEYFNLYSDTSVYWVEWGGANGLRYQLFNYQASVNYPQNYFYSKLHFEKDLLYSMGEHLSDQDYRNFNTERITGEGWFWKDLSRGNSVSDTFRVNYLSPNPQLCYLKLFAYPNSYIDSIYNEHIIITKVNNVAIDTLRRNDYDRFDTVVSFPSSLLNSLTVNQISFTYTNPSTYSGRIYFDMFELTYPRDFAFENNNISISYSGFDTSTAIQKIRGVVPSNQINIYDVKNGLKIINSTYNLDTLVFSGKKNGRFEIANTQITKKPLRIKTRQVPDLVSSSSGTDYLIIYNKLFENQAEQLRQHRISFNNMRTFKAEIEDVYDVFNYGIEDPVAIKYFVKNIYDNWQLPKVKYLCLFGRGSLDPKKNIPTDGFYNNLIPVYGNPNSDGYFANTRLGAFTYNQQIATGRIPVLTIQEAQNVVNKIINYDNTQLDKWIKYIVSITGGFNLSEQSAFMAQSELLLNTYIKPPPISGFPVRIYRNDSTGYATFNYADSIRNAINRGALIVNYIGHAATTFWDNGLEDPNDLNNGERLPLVLSMTCFTGKYSNPAIRSFGENFFLLPNKGAVGFIGTTGWSFSGSGNTFNAKLLNHFSSDTVRYIGDILQYASNSNLQDTSSFAVRNTINCYNLIGDPASKLLLPVNPEFDIRIADYWISNPYPSLRENIVLKIFPKNLGTYADSCKFRFQILKNNVLSSQRDTVVKRFGFLDTAIYNFRIDSAGIYSVKVILDPERWYPFGNSTNNTIIIPLSLKNISYVPIKPINNQFVVSDSVEFSGLNPISGNTSNLKLILNIDTTISFNSPISLTYFKNNPSGVYTRFKIKLPISDSNVVYYWRLNSIQNNTDSSGWSETRKFLYKNNSSGTKNLKQLSDSSIKILYSNVKQFEQTDLINLSYSSDGIKLGNWTGNIFAQSWGANQFDATYMIINQTQIFFTDTIFWSGFNIAKVRKLDGKISELKHIFFTSSSSNDSLINYLNNFDTNYIFVAVKSYPITNTVNINTAARNKLKQFGSIYADSLSTNNLSRWSFISYRGLPIPFTSEGFLSSNTSWSPVQISMAPVFRYTSGTAIIRINPAHHWQNIFLNSSIPQNTYLFFDLYGINNSYNEILLGNNINSNYLFLLDTLNTLNYPGIKIVSKLSTDTNFLKTSGFNEFPTPVLKSISVNYIPPAELAPDNNSFIKSDSILQEGDTLYVQLNNWNVGYVKAGKIIGKWYASSPYGNKVLKQDTLSVSLRPDTVFTPNIRFGTSGLRRPQLTKDTIFLFYETSMLNQNDFYTFNNTAVTKFILTGDTIKPYVDVTYDGVKVWSGDFIQANPQIVLKFFDNSAIFIKDTSNIRVKLNDTIISYYIGGIKNPIIDIIFYGQKNYLQASVIFRPKLASGENKFEYISTDASGNKADTVRYLLNVSDDFKLTDLQNYPNPAKSNTAFLFNLVGSKPPSSCKIKIYTVAGRLIKTLNFNGNIGINQIFWNCLDEDGDSIANGVYLYKLIIEGEGGSQTGIQKLVILK